MTGTDRRILVARRRLLAPLALVAAMPLLGGLVQAARGAAPGRRPRPLGTSATRCAQCGSADHTMLDRRCPAAPRVT